MHETSTKKSTHTERAKMQSLTTHLTVQLCVT